MSSFALFIDTPDTNQETSQDIQDQVKQIGLTFQSCATVEAALAAFEEQSLAGNKPEIILLGPNLTSPIATARSLFRAAPLAHLAFLTQGSNGRLLKQLESPVAMIGTYWSIIDLEDDDVQENLASGSISARQRLQLRTTLDRINGQLSSSARADISKLRQYTVSDRFLANLLENAQDAIMATTNDGTVIAWNNSAEKMFGMSEIEAIGCSIVDIAGGEWAELLPHLIAQLTSSQTAYSQQELTYRKPNGDTLIVEVRLSQVRHEPGNAIGMSFVVGDITSRRSLERQIQQTQKLESLGVLAGGIAHDFNNILTAVLAYSDLAILKLPPDSEVIPYIEKVRTAGNIAADLSKQMLAYSGRGHFFIQPLDLNQIIQDMTQFLQGSISKTAVLEYQLTPDLPRIKGDTAQIQQVIINLVTNAYEAINDNSGLITIQTGLKYCDEKYLSRTLLDEKLEPGSYVFLRITDTGIGMDKETQSKIFDPFFSTKFTGRGLGLAAVLGIARGHKAAIEVYSDEGQGTTIDILFPTAANITTKAIQESRQIEAFDDGGTILVIDDEEPIREAVKEILKMAGFNILTAKDGIEGLKIFQREKDTLSLVILDLTMPRLNGEEVFLQMHHIKPEVPVILASGYNEDEVTNRFAGKGLAAFIQKPFSHAILLAKVKQVLHK